MQQCREFERDEAGICRASVKFLSSTRDFFLESND